MVCLQKGRWNRFYLQRWIFRTLFVLRVLSLKVMAHPGNDRSGYISQGIVENNCPHKWNYLKAQQSITNLISIQWNYMRNNR